MWWLWGVVAWGGTGPWVLGPGQGSLFVGLEAQRFGHLAIVDGGRDVLEVDDGVSTLGAKAIGTVGLSNRAEIEVTLPWAQVNANQTDGETCALLGLGACLSTSGVGVIEGKLKGQLLDEVFGAPLSLSAGVALRFGQLTGPTRQRITNLGEGSLDVGPFVTLGRSGRLGGGGLWSGWIEVQGRGRFPLTRDFPTPTGGSISSPIPEGIASAEVLLGTTRISLGPTASVLWRPSGLDWGELDLTEPDRFGALKSTNVRVGGTVVLRGEGRLSVAGWFLATAFASNNPSDTFVVGLGVQVAGPLKRSDPLR